MAPRSVAAAPLGEGKLLPAYLPAKTGHNSSGVRLRTVSADHPTQLGEALERVRALQQAEQLTVTSRRGIAKERELLLAQLEEHNYHLRYNLKMRDLVTESLVQWAVQNDSGEPDHFLLIYLSLF